MKIPSLLFFLFATSAYASGFVIPTQGARATGMGTAYAAVADDPSGIYYNPAGLVGPVGFDAQVGDTLIAPMLQYQSPGGEVTRANLELLPPPHLYLRYGIHPRVVFGLGLFSPYGASVRWPQEWAGRYFGVSSQLSTYEVNPVAAIRFHEKVKGGFGVRLVRGTMQLDRDVDFIDSAGKVSLGGAGWGFGFVGGAQLQVIKDYFEVGVTWRTGIDLPVKGSAHFENIPADFQPVLYDQGVETTLRLVDVWMAGFKSRPIPKLLLALDGHYTTWNGFRQLRLRFDNPDANTEVLKIWRDTVSVHAGGEYDVDEALKLRAGLSWDPTGAISGTLAGDLPDATRYKLALGAGYAFGNLRLDGAYQFVLMTPNNSTVTTAPGSYSGSAHELAVTLAYKLN